jgi:hypothetical protein
VLVSYFSLRSANKLKPSTFAQVLLMIGLIFYIGFRPISGRYFGDMSTYAKFFEAYASGYAGIFDQDPGFDWFTRISVDYLNLDFFFLLIAFIYVYAHYWASKRFFSSYWYYGFIIFIASFSFWGAATNGLRNGMALL